MPLFDQADQKEEAPKKKQWFNHIYKLTRRESVKTSINMISVWRVEFNTEYAISFQSLELLQAKTQKLK